MRKTVQISEKISIVIPCYRSAEMISSVVEEIISVINNFTYEIILVCDCSPDDEWKKIKNLHNRYPNVHGILLSKNFGQHSAIMAGYREVTGDIVVTMDDDGQSDPEGIPPLVYKIIEGFDVVYARYPTFKKSALRILFSAINRKMAELLVDKPKGIQGNSFFAMRRFVMNEIIQYTRSYPYIGGLVCRTTSSITEIEINHRIRKEGNSGYTMKKLFALWLNGFTAFSVVPLRVASLLGICFSIMGFLLGVLMIVRKFLNPMILLGYSSMMATIFFLGGLLLLSIGLIGEYVGRIYMGINQAPQYVVKETTDNKDFFKDEI